MSALLATLEKWLASDSLLKAESIHSMDNFTLDDFILKHSQKLAQGPAYSSPQSVYPWVLVF